MRLKSQVGEMQLIKSYLIGIVLLILCFAFSSCTDTSQSSIRGESSTTKPDFMQVSDDEDQLMEALPAINDFPESFLEGRNGPSKEEELELECTIGSREVPSAASISPPLSHVQASFTSKKYDIYFHGRSFESTAAAEKYLSSGRSALVRCSDHFISFSSLLGKEFKATRKLISVDPIKDVLETYGIQIDVYTKDQKSLLFTSYELIGVNGRFVISVSSNSVEGSSKHLGESFIDLK